MAKRTAKSTWWFLFSKGARSVPDKLAWFWAKTMQQQAARLASRKGSPEFHHNFTGISPDCRQKMELEHLKKISPWSSLAVPTGLVDHSFEDPFFKANLASPSAVLSNPRAAAWFDFWPGTFFSTVDFPWFSKQVQYFLWLSSTFPIPSNIRGQIPGEK